MKFDYDSTQVFSESIDIEDIGNCALELIDSLGNYYYLIIITKLGFSSILEQGPIIPDLPLLPKSMRCIITTCEFKRGRIIKIIETFLKNRNDDKNATKSVVEISIDDALNRCLNPIDCMRRVKEE